MLINPPIVFTFTRQRWSSSTLFISSLAVKIKYTHYVSSTYFFHLATKLYICGVYCENSLRGYFKVAIRGLCGKMSIIIDINKKLVYKNSKWWVELILHMEFQNILHQTHSAPKFILSATNKFLLTCSKLKTQLLAILIFVS
jgi:hypothetical protein